MTASLTRHRLKTASLEVYTAKNLEQHEAPSSRPRL